MGCRRPGKFGPSFRSYGRCRPIGWTSGGAHGRASRRFSRGWSRAGERGGGDVTQPGLSLSVTKGDRCRKRECTNPVGEAATRHTLQAHSSSTMQIEESELLPSVSASASPLSAKPGDTGLSAKPGDTNTGGLSRLITAAEPSTIRPGLSGLITVRLGFEAAAAT